MLAIKICCKIDKFVVQMSQQTNLQSVIGSNLHQTIPDMSEVSELRTKVSELRTNHHHQLRTNKHRGKKGRLVVVVFIGLAFRFLVYVACCLLKSGLKLAKN